MNSDRISLRHTPVVGILRGFNANEVEEIVHAASSAGLRFLEITMNSPDAVGLIRRARTLADGDLEIGAGTVLNEQALDTALEAGARFIVTPVVNEAVIRRCLTAHIPVIPGAFSLSEIARAWDLGATLVKVFPADQLGVDYIRSVKTVLPRVKLLPTGGVTLESLPSWLTAGSDGFGIGSPMFDPQRVRAGDWSWIEERCRAILATVGSGA